MADRKTRVGTCTDYGMCVWLLSTLGGKRQDPMGEIGDPMSAEVTQVCCKCGTKSDSLSTLGGEGWTMTVQWSKVCRPMVGQTTD